MAASPNFSARLSCLCTALPPSLAVSQGYCGCAVPHIAVGRITTHSASTHREIGRRREIHLSLTRAR